MISGKARLAGVMGWPVSHSQSPRLHGFWLDRYAIDGAYVPLPVEPENFEAALRALPKLGFAGVNVTVPHKEAALGLVDEVDPVARQIGAVNTIVVKEDGALAGFNTDAFGFMENLLQTCKTPPVLDRPAVVLGAGGAARAVLASLIDFGVPEIHIVNRTIERAEALSQSFDGPLRVQDWKNLDQALEGAGLLVNTTSLGMTGKPPLEISLGTLPTDAVVYDIVYSPLKTSLLEAAEVRGNMTIDGLGMLLHQARSGFEKWFGTLPEVDDELRQHVLKGLNG